MASVSRRCGLWKSNCAAIHDTGTVSTEAAEIQPTLTYSSGVSKMSGYFPPVYHFLRGVNLIPFSYFNKIK